MPLMTCPNCEGWEDIRLQFDLEQWEDVEYQAEGTIGPASGRVQCLECKHKGSPGEFGILGTMQICLEQK